ncbi:MAG: retropepsin-like aspartic protease [Candidatus Bathyarchaeia archaeon]
MPSKKSVTCKYLFYRYTMRNGTVRTLLLPLVHVRIESPEEHIETDALVDSGATRTLIPKEIAEILPSLKYEEQRAEVTGAGGVFLARVTRLKKLTLIKNITPFAHFVEIEVLVPDHEGILPYVILGRDYVFRRFDITFHEKRRKLTFTEI